MPSRNRKERIETWGYDPDADLSRARKMLADYRWLPGGLLVVALLFVLNEAFATVHFFEEYGANLATDGVGVLVTVGIVERIVHAQRDHELAGVRARALQRLHRALVPLVVLLADMASAVPGRDQLLPMDACDVIERWRQAIGELNLLAPVPLRGIRVSISEDPAQVTWLRRTVDELQRFESRAAVAVDLYAEALGVEVIAAVEDVLECRLLHQVQTEPMATLAQVSPLPSGSMTIQWPADEGTPDPDVAEFATRLRSLVSLIERKSGSSLLTRASLIRNL
jgi:hypothetical protein